MGSRALHVSFCGRLVIRVVVNIFSCRGKGLAGRCLLLLQCNNASGTMGCRVPWRLIISGNDSIVVSIGHRSNWGLAGCRGRALRGVANKDVSSRALCGGRRGCLVVRGGVIGVLCRDWGCLFRFLPRPVARKGMGGCWDLCGVNRCCPVVRDSVVGVLCRGWGCLLLFLLRGPVAREGMGGSRDFCGVRRCRLVLCGGGVIRVGFCNCWGFVGCCLPLRRTAAHERVGIRVLHSRRSKHLIARRSICVGIGRCGLDLVWRGCLLFCGAMPHRILPCSRSRCIGLIKACVVINIRCSKALGRCLWLHWDCLVLEGCRDRCIDRCVSVFHCPFRREGCWQCRLGKSILLRIGHTTCLVICGVP
mmetsp:Transcript_129412/g.335596  ORF Transcript_129412/g.335596 Transcript_129412/m.335596 type:complete len:362 (+) Transcript_129412:2858-3943(+)